VYANVLEFRPCDFAAVGNFNPQTFPPVGLRAPGSLTLGSAPYF